MADWKKYTSISQLSPQAIRAIEIDTRSTKGIADCFGCSTDLVKLIKMKALKRDFRKE